MASCQAPHCAPLHVLFYTIPGRWLRLLPYYRQGSGGLSSLLTCCGSHCWDAAEGGRPFGPGLSSFFTGKGDWQFSKPFSQLPPSRGSQKNSVFIPGSPGKVAGSAKPGTLGARARAPREPTEPAGDGQGDGGPRRADAFLGCRPLFLAANLCFSPCALPVCFCASSLLASPLFISPRPSTCLSFLAPLLTHPQNRAL